MPYEIIWEENGVVQHFFGDVSFQDIKTSDEAIYGDERFDSIKYLIIDNEGVTEPRFDQEGATELAYTNNVAHLYKPVLKVAFICTKQCVENQVKFYIKTMLEIGSTWKFKMFDSMAAARAWIQS
jgi:hypothetical protein